MVRLFIGGVGIFGWLGFFLSLSYANPHYSILIGARDTGSHQFAQEFSRLWEVPAFKMEGALVLAFEINSQSRLKRLQTRQGDFAILSPQTAYQLLPQNLEIAVISLLWPNVLHVMTRSSELTELDLNNIAPLYIHENSDYFAETWSQMFSFQVHNPSQLHWFKSQEYQDVFSQEDGTIILTAPYPLEALHPLATNPNYRLIPLNKTLHSAHLQHHPWLTSHLLPDNIYRVESINLLTSYPILVARADSSRPLIQKVLKMLFSQQAFINPHPLFRFLNPQDNQRFKERYHFHATSKKFFKL